MLLFRSEDEVRAWCRRHDRPQGEVLPLAQVWALSQDWYHNRMDPAYRGRTGDDVVQIFEGLGLASPFWKPG